MQAGTKVKILMRNGLHFSGIVQDDNSFFLEILDKFNKKVLIGKGDISSLEVLP